MGLYLRLQGRADALIRKYGAMRTVTRWSGTPQRRASDMVYDPSSGTMKPVSGQPATIDTQFQVPIVTFPYEIRFVNDTTIKRTDLWGLFSAIASNGKPLPDIPQPGDKLDMNGVEFTFGMVRPLDPGGVPVYYEVHLTQG